MGERELYEYWYNTQKFERLRVSWTQEMAAQVLEMWQTRFAEEVRKHLAPRYSIHAFSTATLNHILTQFSELRVDKVAIGFGIMVSSRMLRYLCKSSS